MEMNKFKQLHGIRENGLMRILVFQKKIKVTIVFRDAIFLIKKQRYFSENI